MFDETNGTQISSGPQWKVAHIYSTDNAKRQTKKTIAQTTGFDIDCIGAPSTPRKKHVAYLNLPTPNRL